MTDQEIINRIDYVHDSGSGRGGFQIRFSPPTPGGTLYDDQHLFDYINGEYINPLGPFRKWISIYASVLSREKRQTLYLKKDFWGTCSEERFENEFLRPFLLLLRELVMNKMSTTEIRENHDGFLATEQKDNNDEALYRLERAIQQAHKF